MITIFWLINAIMLLLALAFVLVPIIRHHHKNDPGIRNDLNIHIHKEHLQELKNDFKEGNIDEKEFNDAKHELERNLLTDIAESEKGCDHTVSSISYKTIIPIIIVLPVFVIVTYLMLGDIDMVSIQVDKKEQQSNQEKMHSIEEMVAKLSANLQEQPDNGEGWKLLARTYLMMNRIQDAVHAYQNARKYIGDDPQLLADYAEALIMANNNSYSEEAENLINLSLQANPDEPKALWIAGFSSFERGDIAKTLHYWEQLLNVLPPGSDETQSLLENINKIKQNAAAISPDRGIAVTQVTDSSMTAIDVQVSLASALLEKADPEDTVFIFARASEGPRMPLAIVRKQVKDLPVRVTLDDSTAMSPAMRLSKFKQVVISARISKSGDATPSSGDLSGSSAAIQPGKVTGVNITIDQILP
ncbi:MAG: c-type cytochrome biogenesis protein CcmI [Proteobacteria bacterium]|nr:c-type cytochrome biogenesis protein CcmI [Pseudomonadota bacterium]